MIFGVITVVLMLVFIGIVAWAYSKRRWKTYEKAARTPLEEDKPVSSDPERKP